MIPIEHIFFIILLLSQLIILILEFTLNIIQKKDNKTLRKSFDIISTIFIIISIIILYFFSKIFNFYKIMYILILSYLISIIIIIIVDGIINRENLKDFNKDISNIDARRAHMYISDAFLIILSFSLVYFLYYYGKKFDNNKIFLIFITLITLYNIAIMIYDNVRNKNIHHNKQPKHKLLHYLHLINMIGLPIIFVIIAMILMYIEQDIDNPNLIPHPFGESRI